MKTVLANAFDSYVKTEHKLKGKEVYAKDGKYFVVVMKGVNLMKIKKISEKELEQ